MLIFTGGMPRASFGDKCTVAVHKKNKQLVFDCSSRVIDIIAIDSDYLDDEPQNPHTLLILCEEELVAIDLAHPDWLPFSLPYLCALHASPITACTHVAGLDGESRSLRCITQNRL